MVACCLGIGNGAWVTWYDDDSMKTFLSSLSSRFSLCIGDRKSGYAHPRKKILLTLVMVILATWLVLISGERVLAPALQIEDVRSEKGFAVRSAETFMVAQVRVAGTYQDAFIQGVAILDRYREGDNLRQPIEIITVRGQVRERSEQLGRMFPYLLQEEDEGTVLISMILPGAVSSQSAPRPTDPRIRISTVPASHFAVRSVPRTALVENAHTQEEQLRELLTEQGYVARSVATVAVYDLTWTPAWFERTELWIPVALR